jgi:ClpP class serine protease
MTHLWLLDDADARIMASARRAKPTFTAEEIRAYDEAHPVPVAADGEPYNMSRAGSTVEIRVEGILTERPDLWAWWTGQANTTYDSIVRGLAIAKSDKSITEVVLRVNSPGGTVDGLFDALSAIETFRYDSKKRLSVVATKAQSAAYAISALAGDITAAGPASMFGSIGTAIDFVVYDGVKIISLTNSDSPDKRPDPETAEGQKVIVEFLDAVNELFVDAIARGRGIAVKDVTEGFGRGATFVAGEAKKRGMIDALPKSSARRSAGPTSEDITPVPSAGAKEKLMDLETLRAQHPEVYKAAVATGVTQERERVSAHLEMGKVTGAAGMKLAHESIENGAEFGTKISAQYAAAGIAASQQSARQSDSDAAGKAVDGAKPEVEAKEQDAGDVLVAHLKAQKSKVVL